VCVFFFSLSLSLSSSSSSSSLMRIYFYSPEFIRWLVVVTIRLSFIFFYSCVIFFLTGVQVKSVIHICTYIFVLTTVQLHTYVCSTTHFLLCIPLFVSYVKRRHIEKP